MGLIKKKKKYKCAVIYQTPTTTDVQYFTNAKKGWARYKELDARRAPNALVTFKYLDMEKYFTRTRKIV